MLAVARAGMRPPLTLVVVDFRVEHTRAVAHFRDVALMQSRAVALPIDVVSGKVPPVGVATASGQMPPVDTAIGKHPFLVVPVYCLCVR